jgi:hypothetical protein
VLAVLLLSCCGVGSCLSDRFTTQKRDELAQADRLYQEGRKAEAVAKYKAAFSYAGDRKAQVLNRIVGFALEQGEKRWPSGGGLRLSGLPGPVWRCG